MAINKLLQSYSPQIIEIVHAARLLILDCFPKALEQVDLPSRLIAYGTGPKYADTVFTLMSYAGWVNLGIFHALELADPHGLLRGTGRLHRQVKLSHLADVQAPALKELLQAAVKRKMGSG
jgi:hypothetical protein